MLDQHRPAEKRKYVNSVPTGHLEFGTKVDTSAVFYIRTTVYYVSSFLKHDTTQYTIKNTCIVTNSLQEYFVEGHSY